MCALKHPFLAKNEIERVKKILNGKYESISRKYSRDLSDLINMCLTKDPDKRPTIQEIIRLPPFQKKAVLLKIALPREFKIARMLTSKPPRPDY